MISEDLLIRTLNAVSKYFDISLEETTVSVPDKFKITDYPLRTQTALKRLKKHGYILQTTIK
jgi:hypothetical protein